MFTFTKSYYISRHNFPVFFNIKVILMLFQLLVVGGSFGLREFTQIRYDSQKIKRKVCKKVKKCHTSCEALLSKYVTINQV